MRTLMTILAASALGTAAFADQGAAPAIDTYTADPGYSSNEDGLFGCDGESDNGGSGPQIGEGEPEGKACW